MLRASALLNMFSRNQRPDNTGLVVGYKKPGHWWQPAVQLTLAPSVLRCHVLVTGAAGTGSYSLVTDLLRQQTQQGRGWVIVDPYGDYEVRDELHASAIAAGRGDAFHCLDFRSDKSDAYSLLPEGQDTAVQVRKLLYWHGPSQAENAHNRLTDVLTAILEVMKAANDADLTLATLRRVLSDFQLLSELPGCLSVEHPAALALTRVLAMHYGDTSQAWHRAFDELRLLSAELGHAEAASTGVPVDFADILRNDKMCYVMLPVMDQSRSLEIRGQCVIDDVLAAVMQRHPKQPEFLFAIREPSIFNPVRIGAYASPARAFGVSLVLQQQDAAMLELLEGGEYITGNTATHIVFRHPGQNGANVSRALLGDGAHDVTPDSIRWLPPSVSWISSFGTVSEVWQEPRAPQRVRWACRTRKEFA